MLLAVIVTASAFLATTHSHGDGSPVSTTCIVCQVAGDGAASPSPAPAVVAVPLPSAHRATVHPEQSPPVHRDLTLREARAPPA